MSAERLREAAKVLRERVGACDPWEGDDDHGSWADEYRTDGGNGTDAAFIRVMHPGVGLALADWLDDQYERITDTDYDEDVDLSAALRGEGDTSEWPDVHHALAVADAILGGAS